MIAATNIIERMIIRGQFIGIRISGFLLFLVIFFARFSIRRIRIPVSPPEITPPIPRIRVKPMNSNWVTMMYRIRGIIDVNIRFVLFDVLRSYLNASLRENERTK